MCENFSLYAATPDNIYWPIYTSRQGHLKNVVENSSNPFISDYTQILNSKAYRRMKYKTQVFFDAKNDHVCTRMEHVLHVSLISQAIANELNLNTELTCAISIGHDLGHSPFGHQGELILNKLSQYYLHVPFWHTSNALRLIDNIELLEDKDGNYQNMNLSYAVRDGILLHSGELSNNGLYPRNTFVSLESLEYPELSAPVTWEGCVVKLADTISYLGRDIDDALALGFISQEDINNLLQITSPWRLDRFNSSLVTCRLVSDICEHSSLNSGITFGAEALSIMKGIKSFNEKMIYYSHRFESYRRYAELIIGRLFDILINCFDGANTWTRLAKEQRFIPKLSSLFSNYLCRYCNPEIIPVGQLSEEAKICHNKKIYRNLETTELCIQAVIDFISGMTDRFAIEMFQELLSF